VLGAVVLKNAPDLGHPPDEREVADDDGELEHAREQLKARVANVEPEPEPLVDEPGRALRRRDEHAERHDDHQHLRALGPAALFVGGRPRRVVGRRERERDDRQRQRRERRRGLRLLYPLGLGLGQIALVNVGRKAQRLGAEP
jgi:hypothetical protein